MSPASTGAARPPRLPSRWRRGAADDRRERGSVLVEFAIVVPLLFTLLLGIVGVGMTYSQKIAVDTAAREASRYAATLPVTNYPALTGVGGWLEAVANVARQNAEGDLDPGVAGLSICVAYVYPSGTSATPNDSTSWLVRTSSGAIYTDTYTSTPGASAPCFADGEPAGTHRVQVQLTRQSTISAVVFNQTVTITSDGLTRFEAL